MSEIQIQLTIRAYPDETYLKAGTMTRRYMPLTNEHVTIKTSFDSKNQCFSYKDLSGNTIFISDKINGYLKTDTDGHDITAEIMDNELLAEDTKRLLQSILDTNILSVFKATNNRGTYNDQNIENGVIQTPNRQRRFSI